jgi:hypothetical protein
LKTASQCHTKKFKADFCGNPQLKAYLLGLRAGDFHGRQMRKGIRIQTSTTHKALFNLMKFSFENYGEPKSYLYQYKNRQPEWFIYTDLNSSFMFLCEKPKDVPDWICESDSTFLQFFTAYFDCEGSVRVFKGHEKFIRFALTMGTGDDAILKSFLRVLKSMGYHPLLYTMGKMKSIGKYQSKLDMYRLVLYRKNEVLHLIERILPISKHSEKIRKMNLVLQHKDSTWDEIEDEWYELKAEIKKEIIPIGTTARIPSLQ